MFIKIFIQFKNLKQNYFENSFPNWLHLKHKILNIKTCVEFLREEMFKNNFKVIMILLLLISNLFPSKASQYCVCPKKAEKCFKCFRPPNKFGISLISHLNLISKHKFNAYKPKWDYYYWGRRIYGDTKIPTTSRVLDTKYTKDFSLH
jgi:hypothetical protein